MRITVATVFLVLIFVSRTIGQELKHAPTIDVCRADAAVWWDQDIDQLNRLGFQELNDRGSELTDCEKVDSENANRYRIERLTYVELVAARYMNFVARHHMTQEFKAEDKAGAR